MLNKKKPAVKKIGKSSNKPFNIEESNYYLNFDDSSDEEDTKIIANNNIEWFERATSVGKLCNLLGKLSDLHSQKIVTHTDLVLSFLAHEFGIRLLKSQEVDKLYRSKKIQELKKNKVLSDENFTNCVNAAWEKALKKTAEDNLDQYNTHYKNNEEALKKFSEYIIDNKRNFIKAVNLKHLDNILNKQVEILLPNTEISITPQKIIEATREVYSACGIAIGNNVIFNRKAKIKEKLLEQEATISIENFANNNIVEFQRIICTKLDIFYNSLNSLLLSNIEKISKNSVKRGVLPNVYNVSFKDYSSSIEFLAYLRLMTKSNIRLIKNFKNNGSIVSDEEILIRVFNYIDDVSVTERQILYKKSSCRADSVDIGKIENSTSYTSIIKMISNLKTKLNISDKLLAQGVIDILGKGKIINSEIIQCISKAENSLQQEEIKKFLHSLTYLLFGSEVVRNPASLIIHYMMLELIIEDNKPWENILSKAPMTIDGAVQASRWQHSNYENLLKYSYDKTTPDINTTVLIDFINQEASIFQEWLRLKNISPDNVQSNPVTLLEILEGLINACKKWYNIQFNISFKDSIIEIFEDVTCNSLSLEQRQECESLSIKETQELYEIIENNKEEAKNLLNVDVSLKKIQEHSKRIQEMGNNDVVAIMRKEGLDFDTLLEKFSTAQNFVKAYNTYEQVRGNATSDFLEWLDEADILGNI
ncbi:hypothetical protein [Rickettsia bellii]|uniref:Uncharacterized protein n=1 Tax=Rickettsia bellii (strain RML369-C) TaxID=336407 RepID=Q1RJD5_RICBR|nr:hypothetical protein [Rickettsia bellii]ABE04529.1 unknown [Rickettsia bellii RML369-C]